MRPCTWPLTELVPHRPPMLLLDEVLGFDDTGLQAALTIRADSLFMESQGGGALGVPSHVGIEYMAQACAAFAGAQARLAGGGPRIGFLLGARRFQMHRPCFHPGEKLLVAVTLAYRDEAMGSFTGRIEIAGKLAAESDLTVYEPPANGELPA